MARHQITFSRAGYCATAVPLWDINTAEPWTPLSVLAAVILIGGFVYWLVRQSRKD
ncbi:MAG TPA: hypothetical protein VID03_02945 [Acidimicrobiia bacterium]